MVLDLTMDKPYERDCRGGGGEGHRPPSINLAMHANRQSAMLSATLLLQLFFL